MRKSIKRAKDTADQIESSGNYAIIMALLAIAEELERLNENLEYVTKENGAIVIDIHN